MNAYGDSGTYHLVRPKRKLRIKRNFLDLYSRYLGLSKEKKVLILLFLIGIAGIFVNLVLFLSNQEIVDQVIEQNYSSGFETQDGTIEKVLKKGMEFEVKLEDGKSISVSLTGSTDIKWWDSEKNLEHQIEPFTLSNLQPGRKVKVSYEKNDLDQKNPIPLTKFIIIY